MLKTVGTVEKKRERERASLLNKGVALEKLNKTKSKSNNANIVEIQN